MTSASYLRLIDFKNLNEILSISNIESETNAMPYAKRDNLLHGIIETKERACITIVEEFKKLKD